MILLSACGTRLPRMFEVVVGASGEQARERSIWVHASYSKYVSSAVILLVFVVLDAASPNKSDASQIAGDSC